MLDIVLLGLNHKTAPIEIRECLAFSEDETDAALENLQNHPAIKEVLLFSTCNRVEVLLTTDDLEKAVEAAKTFFSEFKNIPVQKFENTLYIHDGNAAVRHIFRVAASLDSMVVGEPQILGQIKEAYRAATTKKTSGVILNRLLHRTFFVAKRVRSETGIGGHAVSISYAAIELGRKIFGTLQGKKVLLIGAGEMAELAVENLIRHKAGDIFVANRTFERGAALANRFSGKAVRFEEIGNYLQVVDIIISSTGSPTYVIKPDQIKGLMRKRRNTPLFFIDIAVPRDIDPQINRLSNVYVYDIDDLKGVIDENIQDRRREAIKGERIVDEAVIRFRQWYDSLSVVPTIKALRSKMEAIAEKELKKTLHGIDPLSEEDNEAINRMIEVLINKILHEPTLFLKGDSSHADRSVYLDATRKLFNLDD
ncbi:glutamyl-tRNA reductase [Thermodesulfobacteriota bacterium]